MAAEKVICAVIGFALGLVFYAGLISYLGWFHLFDVSSLELVGIWGAWLATGNRTRLLRAPEGAR